MYFYLLVYTSRNFAENNVSGKLGHQTTKQRVMWEFFFNVIPCYIFALESCENFTCLNKLYFKEIETYSQFKKQYPKYYKERGCIKQCSSIRYQLQGWGRVGLAHVHYKPEHPVEYCE